MIKRAGHAGRGLIAVALGIFLIVQALWALDVPPLRGRINDYARLLSASEIEKLESQLYEFEAQTSNQIAVLIIPTLAGESIEGYAIKVAEKWRLGTAEKDNGVLLLIALEERQLRIEVGYGLEGALTDMLASQIIRYEIAPHFKQGDYFAGLQAGLTAIMQATRNEYQGEPGRRKDHEEELGKLISFLFFFILFVILGLTRRGRRGLLGALILSSLFRNGGGGWRSGGGFGGGGFGGFSGGGGGFGGGGASGGW